MNEKKVALLSVYEKSGIIDFARGLLELGWWILASGGTCKHLREAGLSVWDVADLIGGGAILGHRVVTLSREIYAGILARDTAEDQAELDRLGIPRIGLVCVDMYPLHKAISKPGATLESVIESTDIGGPTLVRAAAKAGRIVICDPADRRPVIEWLSSGQRDQNEFLEHLAGKAEAVVANYCLTSARYRSSGVYEGLIGQKLRDLAYAENRWQGAAAVYRIFPDRNQHDGLAPECFEQVAGAPTGYINMTDLDRALQTMVHMSVGLRSNTNLKCDKLFVAVKHGNVCGAAASDLGLLSIRQAVAGDPLDIFGATCMANFPIDADMAVTLRKHLYTGPLQKGRPLDQVIAPSITAEAIEILDRQDFRCRVIVNPSLGDASPFIGFDRSRMFRQIRGGFLTQGPYDRLLQLLSPHVAIYGEMDHAQRRDLSLAWAVGSTSNSNTITLARDGMILANAIGQQSRIDAALLAIEKARRNGHLPGNFSAYSDSFFPDTDAVEVLVENHLTALLTSRGGKRYAEIEGYLRQKGVAIAVADDEYIRGFFGH